ncbi:hypothetical protein GHT09_016310 [Marmota monax]|uniref:Uncharacterized protein n=1 Tax=Marmota monax TaxID=9995 RepID=A0A834Q7Y1_MARMO|nr:hypothetical protein GHT09_016310 [Marmota monax]
MSRPAMSKHYKVHSTKSGQSPTERYFLDPEVGHQKELLQPLRARQAPSLPGQHCRSLEHGPAPLPGPGLAPLSGHHQALWPLLDLPGHPQWGPPSTPSEPCLEDSLRPRIYGSRNPGARMHKHPVVTPPALTPMPQPPSCPPTPPPRGLWSGAPGAPPRASPQDRPRRSWHLGCCQQWCQDPAAPRAHGPGWPCPRSHWQQAYHIHRGGGSGRRQGPQPRLLQQRQPQPPPPGPLRQRLCPVHGAQKGLPPTAAAPLRPAGAPQPPPAPSAAPATARASASSRPALPSAARALLEPSEPTETRPLPAPAACGSFTYGSGAQPGLRPLPSLPPFLPGPPAPWLALAVLLPHSGPGRRGVISARGRRWLPLPGLSGGHGGHGAGGNSDMGSLLASSGGGRVELQQEVGSEGGGASRESEAGATGSFGGTGADSGPIRTMGCMGGWQVPRGCKSGQEVLVAWQQRQGPSPAAHQVAQEVGGTLPTQAPCWCSNSRSKKVRSSKQHICHWRWRLPVTPETSIVAADLDHLGIREGLLMQGGAKDILTEDDVYCSCLAKTLCHVPVPVTVGFYAPFGCRLHMMLDKITSKDLGRGWGGS